MRKLVIIVMVALAAGCGSSHASPSAGAPSLFTDDTRAPLAFRDAGRINRGYPIAVHDVSFASPRGGRVKGYLVVPPAPGRHPAVLFMHGSGAGRLQFVVPATWLAARGAVGLTIDGPKSADPTAAGLAGVRQQRDAVALNVIELRRAIDVLQSLPSVDPQRIAYVGYSAGARVGAVLAGVDHRIRAYDLISGGSPLVDEFVRAFPQSLAAPSARLLDQVDPLRFVAHAAPAHLLFQDGKRDTVVPHADLVGLYRAASRPKELRWYDGGHSPTLHEFHDSTRWLAHELGLGGPVVKGARPGP